MRYLPSSPSPGIFDATLVDGFVTVSHAEAMETLILLARQEGIMVGHSSGANAAAAMKVAEESPGAVIVTIFADSGSRYLSSTVWSDLCAVKNV
jgi:cysteine synthase B